VLGIGGRAAKRAAPARLVGVVYERATVKMLRRFPLAKIMRQTDALALWSRIDGHVPAALFADGYFALCALVLWPLAKTLFLASDAIQPNPNPAPFVFRAMNGKMQVFTVGRRIFAHPNVGGLPGQPIQRLCEVPNESLDACCGCRVTKKRAASPTIFQSLNPHGNEQIYRSTLGV